MKRNKLIFSAGILYVIASAIFFLVASDYLNAFLSGNAYSNDLIAYDHAMYIQVLVVLASMTVYKFAEAILFLVFGIKLIKKSKKFPDSGTGVATAGMILGYIFALVENSSRLSFVIFALLLAGAILITIACSKKDSFGYGKWEDLSFAEKKNYESIGVKNDEDMAKLIEKTKSLQHLKDSGIISNEEYLKLLKEIVITKNNQTSDLKVQTSKNKIFRASKKKENDKWE